MVWWGGQDSNLRPRDYESPSTEFLACGFTPQPRPDLLERDPHRFDGTAWFLLSGGLPADCAEDGRVTWRQPPAARGDPIPCPMSISDRARSERANSTIPIRSW